MEGARNRRCGERQDVHLASHRLDALLVRDAEALLLVDDQQTEIGEADVLRQDSMGADQDVDAAVGDPLDDPLLFLPADEAAEHRDPQREGGEAALEGVEMLLGENGGRDQHRHLLPILHRLERGTQCDLGFAIADVADHEPIHRPSPEHVGLDLLDAARLVRRLGVREALLELALPGRVGAEREAGRGLARRVDLDQLARQVADGTPHARLRPLPLGAAELAERRRRPAAVSRDAADLVGRQEDLVGAGEVELEVFLHVVAEGALRHPDVAGDAMVHVHDVVTGLELANQVAGDHALAAGETPDTRGAEQLPVGEQQQAARRVAHPSRQRTVDEADGSGLRHFTQLCDRRGRVAGLLEQLADPARLVGGHHHSAAVFRELQQPGSCTLGPTGQWRRGAVPGVLRVSLLQPLRRPIRQGAERDGRVIGRGPRVRNLTGGDEAGVAVGGLPVECASQGGQLVVIGEDEVAPLGKVVRGRTGGEERGPCLGRLAEVALLEARNIVAELIGWQRWRAVTDSPPSVGGQELRRREQFDRSQATARPLRHRIEAADRLDLVAEQLEPDGISSSRRPGVDEAAAMGELGDAGDLDNRLVPARHQGAEEVVLSDPLADA